MPEHANNYFGWSFGLAVVGCVACIISSTLFFTEANIQKKKRKYLKESQTKFEMDQETKAWKNISPNHFLKSFLKISFLRRKKRSHTESEMFS